MSEKREDGRPVFSTVYMNRDGEVSSIQGMTLRDYFAAHALNSWDQLAIAKITGSDFSIIPEIIARMSYAVADTMIAERNK